MKERPRVIDSIGMSPKKAQQSIQMKMIILSRQSPSLIHLLSVQSIQIPVPLLFQCNACSTQYSQARQLLTSQALCLFAITFLRRRHNNSPIRHLLRLPHNSTSSIYSQETTDKGLWREGKCSEASPGSIKQLVCVLFIEVGIACPFNSLSRLSALP